MQKKLKNKILGILIKQIAPMIVRNEIILVIQSMISSKTRKVMIGTGDPGFMSPACENQISASLLLETINQLTQIQNGKTN